MSSFTTLGGLEILRQLATTIQENTARSPRFAYAGDEAWKKIVAEGVKYTGSEFTSAIVITGDADTMEFQGLRVTLDSSLPPDLILVGIEHDTSGAIP